MNKVVIIAEAGVNHNGSIVIAKKLIDVAANAGADFVKFQTFKTENLVSKRASKAEYQKRNTSENESQFEMIKKLELTFDDHLELLNYCKLKGIKFLSTAFDLDSIELLKKLDIIYGKVPSGEITNYPFLVKMATSFDKLILSTGMSELNEIKEALNVFIENGKSLSDISVLHCNTEYPTPMNDVNLLVLETLRRELNVQIGYSDHTLGIEVPIAAVALGATIIEKHFTLDKKFEGPDHKASLNPNELFEMVKAIRNIEIAMGSAEKTVTPSEMKNREVARKSIIAKTKILKGEIFTTENITVKRPGIGISPMKWNEIIGTIADCDYEIDDFIK